MNRPSLTSAPTPCSHSFFSSPRPLHVGHLSSPCGISASIPHSTPWRSFPARVAPRPPLPQPDPVRDSAGLPCPVFIVATHVPQDSPGLTERWLSPAGAPGHRLTPFSPRAVFCPGSRTLAFLTATDGGVPSALHSSHPAMRQTSPCKEALYHRNWQTRPTNYCFFLPKNSFPTHYSMLNPKHLLFLSFTQFTCLSPVGS